MYEAYTGATRLWWRPDRVGSSNPAGDQIPGMPTKPGKALMRSIQLRTLG
jgi:hypothetical protein